MGAAAQAAAPSAFVRPEDGSVASCAASPARETPFRRRQRPRTARLPLRHVAVRPFDPWPRTPCPTVLPRAGWTPEKRKRTLLSLPGFPEFASDRPPPRLPSARARLAPATPATPTTKRARTSHPTDHGTGRQRSASAAGDCRTARRR